MKKIMVCYTDGSSRPNPGFGGSGVFGYIMEEAKKARNTNYPAGSKYVFTSKGVILKTEHKTEESYNISHVLEHISSSDKIDTTNNLAELNALIAALEFAVREEGLEKLVVIADSQYVLNNMDTVLTEWVTNGWLTKTGTAVANKEAWEKVLACRAKLEEFNVVIEKIWVKGHSDDPGNTIADLYAVIGMNNAKIQMEESDRIEDLILLDNKVPMSEFKKEFSDDHYIYNYRYVIFGGEGGARNSAYLFSAKEEENIGVRDFDSCYAYIHNDSLASINSLSNRFLTSRERTTVPARIKLLDIKKDKVLNRIIDKLGYSPLLIKGVSSNGLHFLHLINDPKTIIVEEYDYSYVFVMDSYNYFSMLEIVAATLEIKKSNNQLIDLTDRFYNPETKELLYKFRDKSIDLSNDINIKGINFLAKPIIFANKDIPPHRVFKDIGDKIKKVYLYPHVESTKNLATFYIILEYEKENGESALLVHTSMFEKYLYEIVGELEY